MKFILCALEVSSTIANFLVIRVHLRTWGGTHGCHLCPGINDQCVEGGSNEGRMERQSLIGSRRILMQRTPFCFDIRAFSSMCLYLLLNCMTYLIGMLLTSWGKVDTEWRQAFPVAPQPSLPPALNPLQEGY